MSSILHSLSHSRRIEEKALANPILQAPREPNASRGTARSPLSCGKDIGHWNEKFRTTF